MNDLNYWLSCWQQDQHLFFHLRSVHPLLKKYFSTLPKLSHQSVILVPLSGKSLDLIWLSKKHKVIAVEISEKAIIQFFNEQKLSFTKTKRGNAKHYLANNLEIYQADLFTLPKIVFDSVTHIYDRASLLALDESDKKRYLKFLKEACLNLRAWLLISLNFKGKDYQGPPFPLSGKKLKELCEDNFKIERLHHKKSLLEPDNHLYQKGVVELYNDVYLLEPT